MNTTELQLLRALERFETKITLSVIGFSPNTIDNVIKKNARIAYFLQSITPNVVYDGGTKLILNVRYQNTDVSYNDVHVVSSAAEVNGILCQYVGNYKRRLVIFAGIGIDVEREINKFYTVNAPFYPNFTSAKVSGMHNSLISMNFYDLAFDYRLGRVKLAMMENEVDAEVERIAKQLFIPGMSDATKAFLAHNYLAHTITYTLNENARDLERGYLQSAYGALINKKCVCQGYAEAFKRLMDYAKIPCDIVCGQIKGSDEYHGWNILKLNGATDNYHIDVTWDSGGERVSYAYFGLKDSELEDNRSWNREYTPVCNSSKSLLLEGRRGIMRFKPQLLANGASTKIFGY